MDVLRGFIDDRCVQGSGEHITAVDLYKAYRAWCEANGERPLAQKALGLRLQEMGFERGRTKRERTRSGLSLEDAVDGGRIASGDAW